MATGKRYYWLKLKEDFFDSKRIKKLRRLAGGDTYTIIYLKLQLLAMKTDGIIKYTGLEQDFASELALDIDEDAENIKITMAFLLSCGLAETSDNIDYLFPYSIENVGSEGSSAKRMRESRAKLTGSSPESVTLCAQSGTMCAQCDGEKELDKRARAKSKEKNTKPQAADVFVAFANGNVELLTALRDFEEMRNKMRKPMTGKAKQLLLSKLQKDFAPHEWLDALNEAIERCWLTVYPKKEERKGSNKAFDDLRTLHDMFGEE